MKGDQTVNLTETCSFSSCLQQHATDEPQSAVSAPSILLAELNLHTVTRQTHFYASREYIASGFLLYCVNTKEKYFSRTLNITEYLIN